jgi:N-acetylmuramoyl-L-alanine amidase
MLNKLNINKSYPCDKSNYVDALNRKIQWIVIHYTGGTGTALNNVRYYQGKEIKASAHYFVGHASEGAQIYQSVDPKSTAWHCGSGTGIYYSECRNSTSICIEVCCHNNTANKTAESKDWYFDKETVDRLVELVKALMAEYNIDVNHVIRHYDVTHKICPAMWVHDESAWKAFKARLIDKVAEYKKVIQSKCNFSNPDGVFSLTDKSSFAEALYKKWAESYK